MVVHDRGKARVRHIIHRRLNTKSGAKLPSVRLVVWRRRKVVARIPPVAASDDRTRALPYAYVAQGGGDSLQFPATPVRSMELLPIV